MKTKEEFVMLANAFRTELRRRSMVLLSIMVVAIITFVLSAGILGRLLGNHFAVIGIWIVVFFLLLLGLNFYQARSLQSLAWKCELICPSCHRAFFSNDLKLVTATHNCPYCGGRVYA